MYRKAHVFIWLSCLGAMLLLSAPAWGAEVEPKVGYVAGNVKFSQTIAPEEQKYLGLEKPGAFTLKDIKSPYVLVESFNTSCSHCMAQAPVLNNLFSMVQKDAKLKEKLKFVAAGQGNDVTAVKMWKIFHKVPFPVVPDPDRMLGKALNFSPFPVTVVLDKSGKVVWVHIGGFESAEEALKGIKAAVK
jgi:thiol-disulfide isomerase/thioredoxin